MASDELLAAPSTDAPGTSAQLGHLCLCGAGVPSGHACGFLLPVRVGILCFWLPDLLGYLDSPGAASSSSCWLWGLSPLLLGGTLDY